MPLILNGDDVLPVGVHDATLGEFEACFGRWKGSGRRPDLMLKFREYIRAVRQTGWACLVIADGSYVMDRVPDPDDIDVVVAYPPEVQTIIESDEIRPYQKNVIDPWYCKREYRIDLKACILGSPDHTKWVEFFCQVSMKRADKHGLPAGSRKGLVRIIL